MSQRHGEENLKVEVAFATPEKQFLKAFDLAPGTSIEMAIESSGIKSAFPGVDFARLDVGIWGKVATRRDTVRDGDRIELYRPLPVDPRNARRQVANAGGFMGTHRASNDEDQ